MAKCLGEDEENTLDPLTWTHAAKPTGCWDFSTDWAQGGPIIHRELNRVQEMHDDEWEAETWGYISEGPTPLIAAMRCYVLSKLGEEIEIPEELK